MLNARLWQRSRWLHPILACAVGAVLGAGVLVAVRTEVTSLRYELGRLQAIEAEREDRVQRLGVVAAALRAPERIGPRALELGMAYPEPGQVLALPRPDVAAGASP
jgi:glycine/D-amino acid oxidase-like deaminating enzyme